MKLGKYIPLGIYDNVKIGYGTVDSKNLKTIYLKLNSWVQPENKENFDNSIFKSRKKIKNLIYELNNDKFKKESIVDLDISTKGIKLDKRSFMDLEITLFVNESFDIKTNEMKYYIKDLIQDIIRYGLENKNLYNFYKTKK
jgi:hypothetical protein